MSDDELDRTYLTLAWCVIVLAVILGVLLGILIAEAAG